VLNGSIVRTFEHEINTLLSGQNLRNLSRPAAHNFSLRS